MSKALLKTTDRGSQRDSPKHPSVRTLIGAADEAILQVAEQVYQGEWIFSPHMLSHQQHDDCMREL